MHIEMTRPPFGDDNMIVDVARVSHDKLASQYQPERNAGLIRHLAEEGHWSPFAHPHLQFRVTAPIWLARQLVKHQVGLNWNEVSRRYVDDEPEIDFQVGSIRRRAAGVKQGSTTDTSIADEVHGFQGNYGPIYEHMAGHMEDGVDLYNWLIDKDVAPECARQVLPLTTETTWIWTGSLMSCARIVAQRSHPHAQLEAQQFAQLMHDAIMKCGAFPVGWPTLVKWESHRQNIAKIVKAADALLRAMDDYPFDFPLATDLRRALDVAPGLAWEAAA